jgi:hypothetical protein
LSRAPMPNWAHEPPLLPRRKWLRTKNEYPEMETCIVQWRTGHVRGRTGDEGESGLHCYLIILQTFAVELRSCGGRSA